MDSDAIFEFLNKIIDNYNIEITAVDTGFTEGINLEPNL
jgi:hypothetical protein